MSDNKTECSGENIKSGKARRRRQRKRGEWFTKLSTWKKVGVCVLAAVFCFLMLVIVFIADKMQKLDSKDIAKDDIVMNELAEGVGEGFTNFALFGGDSRVGELDKGVRSDSIIIASLNNKTREVKMVSVYRDTLLDLSDGSYMKCNSAYSFGGPEMAIAMLNMNLDLQIEEYVTVDFAAISDVIDLLGGLELELNEAEIAPLNKYVKETAKVAGKKAIEVTKPGKQKLDGVQATTYARIRSTKGGDFRRAERQRYVIEKMVEKLLKSDLGTINQIIDAVFPKIKTSLTLTEIFNYAKSFNKYTLGDNLGFPMDKTTDTIPKKGSVVIPTTLEKNVVGLHEFLYGTEDYQPSETVRSISNNIINMTGKTTGVTTEDWVRPSDMKPSSGKKSE